MDRRTFLGLTAASLSHAPSIVQARRPKHVTVIGAGSAGMSAAYHLEKAGIKATILEASSRWGGRVKRLSGFSDVPLDLGAEWIHDEPTVLGEIVGAGETDLGIETIDYSPQTFKFWHKGKLNNFNTLRHVYEEVKFLDTTWYGFFERFVIPSIKDNIEYNAVVSNIRSNGNGVTIHLTDGRKVETDKVVLAVPLSTLQRGNIAFSDDLLPPNLNQLQNVDFGRGLKVFMRFKERFYPDVLLEGSRMSVMEDTWSSKIFYDAALGKPTQQNLLGLFTVSDSHLPRANLSDSELIEDVLSELTRIFGPVVRNTYVDGRAQNWSQEAHIMGSYSMSNHSDLGMTEILAPVEGKVFFAGEVLGKGNAQATVHGAAFSAIESIDQLKDS
ncbi:MAG: flavin monoamine oxidase family protein [Granulosicoccus sp.]